MPHTSSNKNKVYSGTSGIVSKIPKALYPPAFRDKSRLYFYSTQFNSVEVNSTFYKLPKASTIQKWVQEVKPGFLFSFKLSKTISHVPGLKYHNTDLVNFLHVVSDVVQPGCLLIQFPSRTTVEALPQLEKLLTNINGSNNSGWRIAVEFRHNSWYADEVYTVLKKFNTAVVVHDFAKGATPAGVATSNFLYFRFHGPEPRYRGSYPDEFLLGISEKIKDCQATGKTAFAYFNNTMGEAYNNLVTLNKLIDQKDR